MYTTYSDSSAPKQASKISFAGACAPVLGSYQSYTHSYSTSEPPSPFLFVSNTNVPPCCKPCSLFGGIQGFHRPSTSVNSLIFPDRILSAIEYGVDLSNKVSFTPKFNRSASYVTFSGSAYKISIGNSFSRQKSRIRSAVPMLITIKFTLGPSPSFFTLLDVNFGESSFFMICESSQQKNHPNERINISTFLSHEGSNNECTSTKDEPVSVTRRIWRLDKLLCGSFGAFDGLFDCTTNSELDVDVDAAVVVTSAVVLLKDGFWTPKFFF